MYLKSILLIVANLGLVGLFIYLLRKPGRLSYYLNGRWWLTWLSVAVITLMDRRDPDLIWRTFHEHRCLD